MIQCEQTLNNTRVTNLMALPLLHGLFGIGSMHVLHDKPQGRINNSGKEGGGGGGEGLK